MSTSEAIQRHIEEHNAQIRAAQDALERKRQLERELCDGFAEREKQDRKFNAWALAKARELISLDETRLAGLGSPIDTLDTPSATLLDMTGILRGRAAE